jgi:nitric oxide reductase NorQ protein
MSATITSALTSLLDDLSAGTETSPGIEPLMGSALFDSSGTLGASTSTKKARKSAASAKKGKAAASTPAAPTRVPGPAEVRASKVREALALVDPEMASLISTDEDLDVTDGVDAEVAPVRTLSEPIIRPGGIAYHPRELAGVPDVQALQQLRETGLNLLLAGEPGTGKTAMLEAAFGAQLCTFNGHGSAEAADLVGTYTQEAGGTYRWFDGPLVRAMRGDGTRGYVLFADDLHRTPPAVLARLFPLMDGRGTLTLTEYDGTTITALPGFIVVGAYNPDVLGGAASEDLLSRFDVHVQVGTDYDLARDLGVDERAVRAAEVLSSYKGSGRISWAPQMRELLAFSRLVPVLGINAAVANLLGSAPAEDRDEVRSVLRAHFSVNGPLSLGARA